MTKKHLSIGSQVTGSKDMTPEKCPGRVAQDKKILDLLDLQLRS